MITTKKKKKKKVITTNMVRKLLDGQAYGTNVIHVYTFPGTALCQDM